MANNDPKRLTDPEIGSPDLSLGVFLSPEGHRKRQPTAVTAAAQEEPWPPEIAGRERGRASLSRKSEKKNKRKKLKKSFFKPIYRLRKTLPFLL